MLHAAHARCICSSLRGVLALARAFLLLILCNLFFGEGETPLPQKRVLPQTFGLLIAWSAATSVHHLLQHCGLLRRTQSEQQACTAEFY